MNTDAIKHGVTKGRILATVARDYPHGVDFMVLWQVLSNLGISIGGSTLQAYLVYLEQVGYIELRWFEDDDREKHISLATATTTGLNFIDGVLKNPDPGVIRV